MKQSLSVKLLISAIAFSVLAAACGSGAESADTAASEPSGSTATEESEAPAEESEAPAEESEAPAEAEAATGVDTPAATLARDLTSLLGDHEYLAGAAVLTAVQAGGDLKDPTFKAAATALDNNTQQLGATIGSVYGDEAEAQFNDLWRAHIGFFVDYTLGKATGDAAMAKKAKKDLNGYREDFGAFIDGATEGALPQAAVADALTPHVESTFKAIDAVVSGKGNAFELLRKANGHLSGVATALAGGIATQQGLEGQADSGPAALQTSLTGLFADHEYLAGMSVLTAVQAGGDLKDPTFVAAATALDNNSVQLADTVGSVYGDEGGKQFLDLWRAHIGFFVDYTLGTATGDAKMAKKAQKDLDGYRSDFGAFIEGATEGGLMQADVESALDPHVKSTIAAIDSVVTGEGNGFEGLREANSHFPGIATALSGAIVGQFPDKF